MLCSIIIPFYNRELLLPETLDSILLQSYNNWECILVDDGSTDNSFFIAKKYTLKDARFKLFKRPFYLKKGANTCRNYGFKISVGLIVQWFDSDDIMCINFLQEKVKLFNLYKCDIVVCRASHFDANKINGKLDSRSSISPITNNPPFEYFNTDFCFQTSQASISRNIIDKLPYVFNKKLLRNQETELFVRLLLINPNIKYLDSTLVFIRKHLDSISGNYSSLSNKNQINIDLPAYLSIFLHFKNSIFYTNEVQTYFSNYFFRCLRKMNIRSKDYIYLFLFGLYYSLFPSFIYSFKIFISRFLKNV